jgi:hypothetical protein
MTDLISRLKAAGPSRELDAEIYDLALNSSKERGGRMPVLWWDERHHEWQPPHYTESIDAALTLVPSLDKAEGALWLKLGQTGGARGSGKETWIAEIWGIKNDTEVKWRGIHTSPAIALVIACLKAREDIKP